MDSAGTYSVTVTDTAGCTGNDAINVAVTLPPVANITISGGSTFIITAIVEITKWKIGFSYDVNTSGLNQVSKGQGGYEISLTFMTPNTFQNKERQPSFL